MKAQPGALAAAKAMAFTAALGTAAEVAALSPSSHNCQPWALAALVSPEARGAGGGLLGERGTGPYLALAVDQDRSLRTLPAHAVEMMLSCGMYWELVSSALTALGWPVTATWHAPGPWPGPSAPAPGGEWPPADWPRAWSLLSLGAVDRGPADPAALAALRALAGQRRTNRGTYRAGPGDAAIDRLGSDCAASDRGPAAGEAVSVRLVSDAAERAAVAGLVARYGGRDFSHAATWRETHSYLRRDPADAARQGDGFTLEHLLGPMSRPRHLLARAALAPGTMRLLRAAGYPRLLAAQLGQAVCGSPGLVLIATPSAQPGTAELVRAGSAIARYWLAATLHGLALHPVSILLQHEDVRLRLQRLLGVTGRAVFLARVGEPVSPVPRTPRRDPTLSWRVI